LSIEAAERFRDYSHYFFERQRRAKRDRKRRRENLRPTKELHLRVGIAEVDFAREVGQARRFLKTPVNVRVSVELADPNQRARAIALLERFAASVGEAASGVVPPVDGHRELIVVLWST
jgi:translation initiation factor IF-3